MGYGPAVRPAAEASARCGLADYAFAMLLPPPHILRTEVLPDDAVVVVRGGEHSLDDPVLDRTVGDCWSSHGFFGLSVFADPSSGNLAQLARHTPLARRRLIRTARVGTLRKAAFEVMPTFPNPYHFSIVLPDATSATYAQLRTCFNPPSPNPGFQRDDHR
jgi:hypothetical protein